MFSLISYGQKEPIASDTLQEVEKCHDKGNGPSLQTKGHFSLNFKLKGKSVDLEISHSSVQY